MEGRTNHKFVKTMPNPRAIKNRREDFPGPPPLPLSPSVVIKGGDVCLSGSYQLYGRTGVRNHRSKISVTTANEAVSEKESRRRRGVTAAQRGG